MYNLRYHVASLVAVFVALTVGLVLGGVVAEQTSVSGRVESLVQQLQTRFDALAQENADLKRSLERERSFGQAAAAALGRDVLAGRHVVVVVNAGRADGLDAARSAIEQAGGEISVLMLEKPSAGLDVAPPSALGEGVEAGKPAIEAAARAVAAELVAGGQRPVLDSLIDSGAVSLRGLEKPVAGCVVMALAGDEPDAFGIALGAALSSAGVPCVGVESSARDAGVAAAAAAEGLSAVDHVDYPAGSCSLVWCLGGRAEGWFGFKKGAKAAFPEF